MVRSIPFRVLALAASMLASSSFAFTIPNSHPKWGNTALKSTAVETAVPSDIVAKYEEQLEKMRAKDQTSAELSKDDLKVIHSDDDIIVVDKPPGILCVPSSHDSSLPSLTSAVFNAHGCETNDMNQMVVHRLGMDTSGLVLFAKTKAALRDLNTQFRTRKVTRIYEALLCGSLENDEGEIDLELMRDYEHPPYMRVSTDDLQRALVGVNPDDFTSSKGIGKKMLELPKKSVTQYKVLGREELNGHPVTRVELVSISGRTHQLNVHCAAIGHPIVKDGVYGIDGDAAKYGGLENGGKVDEEAQKAINEGAERMCVHMKKLVLKHPASEEEVTFESKAPF